MSTGERGTIQMVEGKIRRIPAGQGASPANPVIQAGPVVVEVQMPMSVRPATGISWAPVAPPQRISFLGTSFLDVRAALEKVFGEFPIRLGVYSQRDDAMILRGMSAAAGGGAAPYEELVRALQQHGDLELRLEP